MTSTAAIIAIAIAVPILTSSIVRVSIAIPVSIPVRFPMSSIPAISPTSTSVAIAIAVIPTVITTSIATSIAPSSPALPTIVRAPVANSKKVQKQRLVLDLRCDSQRMRALILQGSSVKGVFEQTAGDVCRLKELEGGKVVDLEECQGCVCRDARDDGSEDSY